MDAEEIEALFTRGDGKYAFSRWARPIAPVVFGVDDATLGVVKGALEMVAALAHHEITDIDPEIGSNLMMFFFREWAELPQVPGMDKLVPDLEPLVARLEGVKANQYRFFRFDEAGAIKACFVFLRMDEHLSDVPVITVALSQAAQSILLWSDTAFQERSPLAVAGETVSLHPDVAALIRAAYDPVLPAVSQDASHALRLAARLGTP
ncbi:MAG: hypothetical protein WBB25_09680 [Sulfitobacter sp.]